MAAECVILFRNPSNRKIGFVTDADDGPAIFADMDAAINATSKVPILRAYNYQIVELDEL